MPIRKQEFHKMRPELIDGGADKAEGESPKPEVDTQISAANIKRATEGGEGNLGTGKRFQDRSKKRVKD